MECRSITHRTGDPVCPPNFVVGQLEEDFDGAHPIPEGGFLRSPGFALGGKRPEEGVRRRLEGGRPAVAPVAEFRQQRDG